MPVNHLFSVLFRRLPFWTICNNPYRFFSKAATGIIQGLDFTDITGFVHQKLYPYNPLNILFDGLFGVFQVFLQIFRPSLRTPRKFGRFIHFGKNFFAS